MRGGYILYGWKTEVYDCPGHQKVVMWGNESATHLYVPSSEIKWGCGIVQAIACFSWYKASEKNPLLIKKYSLWRYKRGSATGYKTGRAFSVLLLCSINRHRFMTGSIPHGWGFFFRPFSRIGHSWGHCQKVGHFLILPKDKENKRLLKNKTEELGHWRSGLIEVFSVPEERLIICSWKITFWGWL